MEMFDFGPSKSETNAHGKRKYLPNFYNCWRIDYPNFISRRVDAYFYRQNRSFLAVCWTLAVGIDRQPSTILLRIYNSNKLMINYENKYYYKKAYFFPHQQFPKIFQHSLWVFEVSDHSEQLLQLPHFCWIKCWYEIFSYKYNVPFPIGRNSLQNLNSSFQGSFPPLWTSHIKTPKDQTSDSRK